MWVLVDPDNSERLVHALDDFGFGSLGLTVADFLTPNQVVRLGYPPLRIDLHTSVDRMWLILMRSTADGPARVGLTGRRDH